MLGNCRTRMAPGPWVLLPDRLCNLYGTATSDIPAQQVLIMDRRGPAWFGCASKCISSRGLRGAWVVWVTTVWSKCSASATGGVLWFIDHQVWPIDTLVYWPRFWPGLIISCTASTATALPQPLRIAPVIISTYGQLSTAGSSAVMRGVGT